jgi:broad specificity phosphatase PhoE
MKIHLIRHGLTGFNKLKKFQGQRYDEPLVEEGEQQARDAIASLPEGIKRIYSSDLLRTRQTAAILNEHLNLPIEYVTELREVDVGDMSGKSFDEMSVIAGYDIFERYKAFQYDFRPFAGESAEDVRIRLESVIERVKATGEDALLVIHGGTLRMIRHVFGLPPIGDVVHNASVHTIEL